MANPELPYGNESRGNLHSGDGNEVGQGGERALKGERT